MYLYYKKSAKDVVPCTLLSDFEIRRTSCKLWGGVQKYSVCHSA